MKILKIIFDYLLIYSKKFNNNLYKLNNNKCSLSEIFSENGFKNLDCDFNDLYFNFNSTSNFSFQWNVINKGFHSYITLNFLNLNISTFKIGILIPEYSFLDISTAQDRELSSPQIRKIHYFNSTFNKYEIQHRYIPIHFNKSIYIYPPIFIQNNQIINLIYPSKISLHLPKPFFDSIFFHLITSLFPIYFILFFLIYLIINNLEKKKKI